MNKLLNKTQWDEFKKSILIEIELKLMKNNWMYMIQILLYILNYTLQSSISSLILVQFQLKLIL